MGYDLYFRNLTKDEHESMHEWVSDYMKAHHPMPDEDKADPDAYFDGAMHIMDETYETMRGTGVYERASVQTMSAFVRELRTQGAEKLAKTLDAWEDLEPDLILEDLAGVSVIPTNPPKGASPFDHAMKHLIEDKEGAEMKTGGDWLENPPPGGWEFTWSRFLAFLVRAAVNGDGVSVT